MSNDMQIETADRALMEFWQEISAMPADAIDLLAASGEFKS